MRTSNFFRAIAAAVLTAVLVFAVATDGTAKSLSLQKPVGEGTSFLEEEAGISAYTNIGQTIDLAKAKGAFRTIERETDEYIVGSVPLPDYAETEDVHAYVHRDGWIVTYYLKEEPAAKIVDWNNYGEDEAIKGTKLEVGITIVCSEAEVLIGEVEYYDFRYPDANKVMIVADAVWSGTTLTSDSFQIKLPSDFIFYERSYSHCNKGGGYTSYMYLDEREISRASVSQDLTQYGLLSSLQLSIDVFHTIEVIPGRYGAPFSNVSFPAFGAIVLIYREP